MTVQKAKNAREDAALLWGAGAGVRETGAARGAPGAGLARAHFLADTVTPRTSQSADGRITPPTTGRPREARYRRPHTCSLLHSSVRF